MIRALLVAGLVVAIAGCGGDDDGAAPAAADVDFQASFEVVGSSLRIAWTITNTGTEPLIVADGRTPTETDNTERSGAYVTRRDGDGVEISRRVFPVPGDVEGAQQYGLRGSLLAAGQSREGKEIVLLPLEYHPAAPRGGGDEPVAEYREVVFCLGVLPAGDDTSANRFVRHTQANADAQTVLCSDPWVST